MVYRIDDATAAATLPTVEAAGTGGYFTEGSAGAGTPATLVRASWLNMVQEELAGVLTAASISPDKSNRAQIAAAIKILDQRQAGNYAADTGTANAMVVTLAPVPASLAALAGVPLRVKKGASANTAAVTINVNGLGAVAITHADSSAVYASELPANGFFELVGTGTAFVLTSITAQPTTQAMFSASLGANGYQYTPSGLILQWGTRAPSPANTSVTYSFPITFPTAVYSFVTSAVSASTPTSSAIGAVLSTSQFSLTQVSGSLAQYWMALGA